MQLFTEQVPKPTVFEFRNHPAYFKQTNKQTNVSIRNYPVQQCATCSYNVAIRNKNALLHFQKTFPGYGTTVQKSITKSTQFPVLYLCEQHISTLISKDLQHRFQQLRNSKREYLFNEIQESLQRCGNTIF